MLYLQLCKSPLLFPYSIYFWHNCTRCCSFNFTTKKNDYLSVKRLTDNESCSHHTELTVNLLFLSPNSNLRASTLQKNEAFHALSVRLFTNHLSLTQLDKMWKMLNSHLTCLYCKVVHQPHQAKANTLCFCQQLLLLCTTAPEAARAQLQLRSQTPFLSFLFFSSFPFLAKASLWSFCVSIKFKSQKDRLAFKRVFMGTSHSSLQTLCTAEKAEV